MRILELTDADRRNRDLELGQGDVDVLLKSPAMLWLIAEMKTRVHDYQDAFFTGRFGLPPAIDARSSQKESYLVGLVFFAQEVLGLIEHLRTQGERPERPTVKVKDPFDVEGPR